MSQQFDSTYFFACDRVVFQSEIHQLLETSQRVQFGQLGDPILGKNECCEVRDARAQVRLDVRDAILSEEKRTQARLKREVAELCNVVVGKIDGVVVSCGTHIFDGGNFVACDLHKLISIQLFKCSICSFHTHLVDRVHAP